MGLGSIGDAWEARRSAHEWDFGARKFYGSAIRRMSSTTVVFASA